MLLVYRSTRIFSGSLSRSFETPMKISFLINMVCLSPSEGWPPPITIGCIGTILRTSFHYCIWSLSFASLLLYDSRWWFLLLLVTCCIMYNCVTCQRLPAAMVPFFLTRGPSWPLDCQLAGAGSTIAFCPLCQSFSTIGKHVVVVSSWQLLFLFALHA